MKVSRLSSKRNLRKRKPLFEQILNKIRMTLKRIIVLARYFFIVDIKIEMSMEAVDELEKAVDLKPNNATINSGMELRSAKKPKMPD